MDDKNYKALADAIVIQAGVDYLKSLRILDQAKGDESKAEIRFKARCRLAEVRHFFKSKWYTELCDIDGRRMLKTLNTSYRTVRQTGDLSRIENMMRTTL